MRKSPCLAAIFMLFACFPVLCQNSKHGKEPAGSIAGRVTIEGKAAIGLSVALMPEEGSPQQSPVAKATTDEEGRFQMTGIRAGRYILQPFAPAFVAPRDAFSWRSGKTITLAEDESVEGIELPLSRGGVITGRVTDAEGRPLIEEPLSLIQFDERNRKTPFSIGFYRFQTDDRGVYRIYGVPAGRYIVAAGQEIRESMVRVGFGGGIYVRTFHPSATDESRAEIIEVTAGSETTGIDIKLGRPVRSYTVSGRIVDADTGQPVAGVLCGYGSLSEDGRMMGSYGTGYQSDERGQVRMDGLMPGRYIAFAAFENDERYSDPTPFEVKDSDISGVEIRVRRGGSISGIAVIEGTDDPETLARFSELQIFAFSNSGSQTPRAPRFTRSKIAPDRSFHITGLPPDTFSLGVSSPQGQREFTVIRVERDGAGGGNRIELPAGGHITGIRATIIYAGGRIRGQVKFEGGSLPAGVRGMVFAQLLLEDSPDSPPPPPNSGAALDERGRFLIQRLRPGEYELTLTFLKASPDAQLPPIKPITQKVTLAGEEQEVTIVVNLAPKDRDQ
jgi:protocatechuate 3,4-dioxygenase beta subunit